MPEHRITVEDALKQLSQRTDGKRFAELFAHGSLSVEIYAPAEPIPKPRTPATKPTSS